MSSFATPCVVAFLCHPKGPSTGSSWRRYRPSPTACPSACSRRARRISSRRRGATVSRMDESQIEASRPLLMKENLHLKHPGGHGSNFRRSVELRNRARFPMSVISVQALKKVDRSPSPSPLLPPPSPPAHEWCGQNSTYRWLAYSCSRRTGHGIGLLCTRLNHTEDMKEHRIWGAQTGVEGLVDLEANP